MHGFGGNLKSLKVFESSFLKQKQVYFSLHSIEESIERPLTMEDYARAVLSELNKLNIEKAHFVAHSFGGRVVFKIFEICPYIIDKLVLIDVAGLKPKKTLKKVLKGIQYKIYKKLGVKKLDKFFSDDYKSLPARHQQTFKNVVSEHFDALLSRIKNPALIIYGENDQDTPVYMAKKLNKKLTNSSLEIIKNTGHFCYIEKTDVVLLASFFLTC